MYKRQGLDTLALREPDKAGLHDFYQRYGFRTWLRELDTDCLLYTSDAADDLLCVDFGGRRIIKKTQALPRFTSRNCHDGLISHNHCTSQATTMSNTSHIKTPIT